MGTATRITEVSLDHDLGPDMDGYSLVKFIHAYGCYPDVIYVHSSNVVGVDNMMKFLERYAPEHVTVIRGMPDE